MTTFSELGVKKIARPFEGDKIGIDNVIGKPIQILDYAICPSKKKDGSTYMKLQVRYEGVKRFISTGSTFLQEIMQQVDKDQLHKKPIETKILKNRGYYFEGTIEE